MEIQQILLSFTIPSEILAARYPIYRSTGDTTTRMVILHVEEKHLLEMIVKQRQEPV